MGTTVFDRRPPSAAAVARRPRRHAGVGVLARRRRAAAAPAPRAARCAPTSPSSAAATPGCGPPCAPRSATPGAAWCSSRRAGIGWAASGRNGGFCEASLTHGDENGVHALARRDRRSSSGSAWRTSTTSRRPSPRYGMDVDFERTGALSVATEPHQVEWLREEDGLPRRGCRAGRSALPHLPRGRRGTRGRTRWCIRPSSPLELARVGGGARRRDLRALPRARARRATRTGHRADGRRPRHAPRCRAGDERLPVAAEAQPPHDGAGLRLRAHDRAARRRQLATIGWSHRQGLSDSANQFHYYRLTADNRILFGGYDAVYHYGGRVRAGVRGPAGELPRRSPSTSSRPSRSSRGCVHASLGRRDRHLHAVLRLLRHGAGRAASPTRPASPGSASARPGSPPT